MQINRLKLLSSFFFSAYRSKAVPLLQFFDCASMVLYVAYVLSLFVHISPSFDASVRLHYENTPIQIY